MNDWWPYPAQGRVLAIVTEPGFEKPKVSV
jgi:hypothetical protein